MNNPFSLLRMGSVGSWIDIKRGLRVNNPRNIRIGNHVRIDRMSRLSSYEGGIIEIEDNGIGIPSKDLKRVFDKSFTGSNGRDKVKSTGMGLYIVKKLCNKLGHNIYIESIEKEYTKVIIEFGKNEIYKF